jgi:NADH-quinone oxidoreductase subunit G
MQADKKTLTIDGRPVVIEGERNLLELVRKAGIDLPTFCYHSDLSVYGACRLCIVDIDGRGIQGACSTPPEAGLKVRTQTQELRDIRKLTIELLLANHDQECPTCPKSGACGLQDIARRLGVQNVRFKRVHEPEPVDHSSYSIVRNPNKCVLCGDCVRMCDEVQGIGAIGFAGRGHEAAVIPAFGKAMNEVECVNCGQCAAVCPTGALAVRSEIDEVWQAIHDPKKKVVAQIAPAVRVAIGEQLGLKSGAQLTGQVVAALKHIGFDVVYDTSFSADLTVIEEASEFLARKTAGEKLPQFTSCCPGWVKFCEHNFPDLLPNLSTCKSPQQMLGALAKATLPGELEVDARDLVMVSIMPCTAKKFEARRPEFAKNGIPEVDYVLTTQELARMIEEAGLSLAAMEPASFDMPMGFKTGAGVIFGNSGGVSEAVLRYAAEKVTGKPLQNPDFLEVRGDEGVRFANYNLNGVDVKLAVVSGLRNAHDLIQKIQKGDVQVDLVEVMACPGGCIGGAGQPVSRNGTAKRERTKCLYDADKHLELHKSQENPFVTACYEKFLGEVNGHKAHELLHTHYRSRRRMAADEITLSEGPAKDKAQVRVCVGTSCFLRGSQHVLQGLLQHVEANDLGDRVNICGSFCFERCAHGPNIAIGDQAPQPCTAESAKHLLEEELKSS